jgi:hypothetical protein
VGTSNAQLRPRGARGEAEALFYSLIESAKLAGVEPRTYLGESVALPRSSAFAKVFGSGVDQNARDPKAGYRIPALGLVVPLQREQDRLVVGKLR